MTELNILNWNSGGQNIPHKRVSTLGLLRRRKIDIALLQETHLLAGDVRRLADKNYHVIASSSCTKTRGVAIVARRNLKFKIQDMWLDTVGRLAIAKVEVSGRKIAFISLYAPNVFDKSFYCSLTNTMLELSEYSFIVGGDFNAVWNLTDDKTGKFEMRDQKLPSSALRKWENSMGLTDLWRLTNPTVKDYTFFLPDTNLQELITFLQPLNFFKASIMLCCFPWPGVLCTVMFSSVSSRAPRWRFNNTLLKQEEFKAQFVVKLKEFLEFNIGSVDDPRVLLGLGTVHN